MAEAPISGPSHDESTPQVTIPRNILLDCFRSGAMRHEGRAVAAREHAGAIHDLRHERAADREHHRAARAIARGNVSAAMVHEMAAVGHHGAHLHPHSHHPHPGMHMGHRPGMGMGMHLGPHHPHHHHAGRPMMAGAGAMSAAFAAGMAAGAMSAPAVPPLPTSLAPGYPVPGPVAAAPGTFPAAPASYPPAYPAAYPPAYPAANAPAESYPTVGASPPAPSAPPAYPGPPVTPGEAGRQMLAATFSGDNVPAL